MRAGSSSAAPQPQAKIVERRGEQRSGTVAHRPQASAGEDARKPAAEAAAQRCRCLYVPRVDTTHHDPVPAAEAAASSRDELLGAARPRRCSPRTGSGSPTAPPTSRAVRAGGRGGRDRAGRLPDDDRPARRHPGRAGALPRSAVSVLVASRLERPASGRRVEAGAAGSCWSGRSETRARRHGARPRPRARWSCRPAFHRGHAVRPAALASREGDAGAGRARPDQPRDRGPAVPRREHGQDPCRLDLREARRRLAQRGDRARARPGGEPRARACSSSRASARGGRSGRRGEQRRTAARRARPSCGRSANAAAARAPARASRAERGVAQRPTAANAAGSSASVTSSVSSQRIAGSDVATTGRPGGEVLERLQREAVLVELGRAVGHEPDVDHLEVRAERLERPRAEVGDVGARDQAVEALGLEGRVLRARSAAARCPRPRPPRAGPGRSGC